MGNYKSVSKMFDDILEDSEFSKEVNNKLEETQLIHELVKQRVKSGKTQAEIAKNWGCDPATVSRFEDKSDDDIKLGELAKFCNAIGVGIGISIAPPSHNSAEAIKSCVKQINRHLTELTKLAKTCSDDKNIINGIHQFQAEVLLQLMDITSTTVDSIAEQIELVKPRDKFIESDCKHELAKV